MSGSVRFGTRLEDGTIVGAPGVYFTSLPICSRCQQAIKAEAKHSDADNAIIAPSLRADDMGAIVIAE
jgi:hypothetical protein